MQVGFLSLLLISQFSKREIPLTRKLIDTAQTVGLYFYFNHEFDYSTEKLLKIFQLTNFSTIINNFIAHSLYDKKYLTDAYIMVED